MPLIRTTDAGKAPSSSARQFWAEQINTAVPYDTPEIAVDGLPHLSFWFSQVNNGAAAVTVTIQFSFGQNAGGIIWKNLDNPIVLTPGGVRPPLIALTYKFPCRQLRVRFAAPTSGTALIDYVISATV